MGYEFVPILTTPDTGDFDKYRPKSSMPLLLAGVALVVLVTIAASAFGLVNIGPQIQKVRNKLPFVGGQRDDGWVTMRDPAKIFTTRVPGDPKNRAVDNPGVGIGTAERAWEWELGSDTIVRIGVVENVSTISRNEEKFAETMIEAAKAILKSVGVEHRRIESTQTTVAGKRALSVSVDNVAISSRLTGTLRASVIADGKNLVYVVTRSVEENPPQHSRILSNMRFARSANER